MITITEISTALLGAVSQEVQDLTARAVSAETSLLAANDTEIARQIAAKTAEAEAQHTEIIRLRRLVIALGGDPAP